MTSTYTVTETFVVPDRRRLLKVKIKSLAGEARIIRQEQMKISRSRRIPMIASYYLDGAYVSFSSSSRRFDEVEVYLGNNVLTRLNIAEWRALKKSKKRAKGPLWHELRWHRIGILRQEQRSALIAYGFIRGMHYEDIEANPEFRPNWTRVKQLVEKFGYKQTANVSYEEYMLLKQAQIENFANWQQRADERYDMLRVPLNIVMTSVESA